MGKYPTWLALGAFFPFPNIAALCLLNSSILKLISADLPVKFEKTVKLTMTFLMIIFIHCSSHCKKDLMSTMTNLSTQKSRTSRTSHRTSSQSLVNRCSSTSPRISYSFPRLPIVWNRRKPMLASLIISKDCFGEAEVANGLGAIKIVNIFIWQ